MADFFFSRRRKRLGASVLLNSRDGVDADWYRATYPDIGPALDPVTHYALHGWHEGRSPNPRFSAEWYRKAHPDLPEDVDPLLHHLRERRRGQRYAPHDFGRPEAWTREHGGVDPAFYRARYGDDGSAVDAATHYTTVGWREGRDPNRHFSTRWYLARNPDIAAAGIDPLHHYLVSGMAEGRTPRPTLPDVIRFHEWWSHKFSSFMAVAYLTAVMLDLSIFSIWPLLLLMLGALFCVATYVSLINDWFDRAVDFSAGKANRMEGRSPWSVSGLLAACIVPGAVFSWSWRGDPFVLALYLGSWISFTLYSAPPLRLKYRGLLGPLCDAAGAHLLPTLLLTALVFRWAGAPISLSWMALAGAWSLGCGLRGILYHQSLDLAADAKAGMRTFVGRMGVSRVRRLENAVILPIEAGSLLLLLVASGSRLAVLAFAACLVAELWRARTRRAERGEGSSRELPHPVLFACYELHLPLALLVTSAMIDLRVVLVAVIHAGLFLQHRIREGARRARSWHVASGKAWSRLDAAAIRSGGWGDAMRLLIGDRR